MKFIQTLVFLTLAFVGNAQPANKKENSTEWSNIARNEYYLSYPSTWRVDTSKLYGADLFLYSPKDTATDKFSENVNIMIQDLKDTAIKLDQMIEYSETQIKNALNNVSIMQSKRFINDKTEFHVLIFTSNQEIFKLRTEQYYYLFETKVFVLTLTTEQNKYNQYENVGTKILKSFNHKD